MKHRRRHRATRSLQQAFGFCKKNGQLLFFIALVMLGTVLGCISFALLPSDKQDVLMDLVSAPNTPTDILSGLSAVLSTAFGGWLLLIVVFLLGLTAFGCPLILIIPVFFGFCIGTSECRLYAQGNPLEVLTDMVLPMTVTGIAVLMLTQQAFRFSCAFTQQLLPSGARCGGMWQSFKRYVVGFMLCIVVVFAASVLQVVMCMI